MNAKPSGNNGKPFDVLARLRQKALADSQIVDTAKFRLVSLSKIHAHFRPHTSDLPYTDVIVIVQTSGVGSCYCYGEDPELPQELLGLDAREVETASHCLNVALLDAVYSCLQREPTISILLDGTPEQKAEARAGIIVSEVQGLLRGHWSKPVRVGMVGAVGSVLYKLKQQYRDVWATDLDASLLGHELGGVLVEDGNASTLQRVSESQVVIVTGMTLATRTLDKIILTARAHNTRMLMFCETGANFGGELVGLGVDCVVSEEFPFYMFPGITRVRVFRA